MILAIDAGNSAIKIALVDGGGVRLAARLATREPEARDRLVDTLRDLVGNAAPGELEQVVLVSVVPAWTEAIAAAAARLGAPLLVADHSTIPIAVRVPHPGGVGSDRLLDAYAAARLHGTPVIVVDLGTATTVDAVDAGGAFVGGAILPGIELGMRALATGTAQLPHVEISQLPRAIGRDTESAIGSGTVLGQVGAVRELVERIAVELAPTDQPLATVVVTGGYARATWSGVWLEHLGDRPAIADIVDPDLTIRGLALLHEELAGLPG
ncbi:MAG: type pantothenate kinase [Chloroflexota bacterium]|jgi:type III pantothenate kinase|nr:type pantothenate kinase [Chloroflexota bacterium]